MTGFIRLMRWTVWASILLGLAYAYTDHINAQRLEQIRASARLKNR